jgi:phosphate-selective porin OprO/OprP
MIRFFAIILFSMFSIAISFAESSIVGNGIRFPAADSSFSVRLGARFQTLLFVNKALGSSPNSWQSDMEIRRMRLKLDGFVYNPKLTYKIEFGFSNLDNGKIISQGNTAANIIMDAYFTYNFYRNFTFTAGQFKLPGNRERIISSQNLQFVDRSLVNKYYNLDRDQGIMIGNTNTFGNIVVNEKASIAMGQGRNITEAGQNGFSYTGRIEVLFWGNFTNKGDYFGSDLEREVKPKISLGGGFSFNNNAIRQQGELGSFLYDNTENTIQAKENLKTTFADLVFKYRGVSVVSEYIRKQANNPLTANEGFFRTGEGFVLQAGYLFKNNYEIATRYTLVQPDKKLLNAGRSVYYETEYTLGISKYIVGHNLKIQSDISYCSRENSLLGNLDPTIVYRLQMELGF